MNKRAISAVYVINIVVQALLTPAIYAGLVVLIGWLATAYWGAPDWIYIPLILGGIILGVISMVKFILTTMHGLESLEKQHRADEKRKGESRVTEVSTEENDKGI